MSMQRQTVLALIEAYNVWDLEKIMSFHAPECVSEVLPKSLNIPPMDNTAFAAYLRDNLIPTLRNFHIKVYDIIEDTVASKVAIWGGSTAETDVGPYVNEFLVVFHMAADGGKVVRFREFVDSASFGEFFARMKGQAATMA
ncbi:hypothetical protein QBC47DRAFT_439801 [Echria macrotheca]|uniref:SnoaL-like domain-containing protein n=1 Tax=Echria macrotheca TaxID=438768 RepID=A0AAJ0B162_9PEZI|nr:hypothetical protein QBC47DRAFT_439801 [Echria macrotheca]